MIKVRLECQYCNYKWVQAFFSRESLDEAACPKYGCGDTSLTVRPVEETGDYFGYEPAPAKPDAYITKKNWNY